ncbi:MAG TPA: protein-L-isoaspartate(D-aspartate) O-methyltransferase [Candidatus Anoxymicrobiaceae bacterium]
MAENRTEGTDYYQSLRDEMVEHQIKARGVHDPRVLEAMRRIPRHLFVPEPNKPRAYEDKPLPVGEGQTISQPYIVGWMTELLRLDGHETVLEIGTGTGYQAAILGILARKVYTMERLEPLAKSARRRLEKLGFKNIEVTVGDGSKGFPEHAPYHGIIVTAGSPQVPQALVEQLADGGRLVIPVGTSSMQMLTIVEKHGDTISSTEKGSCVFVPLVGKYGWRP